MTRLITLTRYGAGRPMPVNPGAIAYLDGNADYTLITFAGGETLRVVEDFEAIAALIVATIDPPITVAQTSVETTLCADKLEPPVDDLKTVGGLKLFKRGRR